VQVKGNKLLLLIGTAWLFDALDVALLSFIMPVIKVSWHLTAGQLGAVSAVTSLGMIFGALGCGYLADKWGRKPVLIGTLLLFSVGNLLLALTPNVGWFLLIRFITGMGLGGELPVAATIIADNFKGTQRARMLVLVDSFWAFGWIIASLLAFLVIPRYGWRVTVLITALMGVYALLMRRHLPSSTQKSQPTKRLALGEAWQRVWSTQYRRTTSMVDAVSTNNVLFKHSLVCHHVCLLWPVSLVAKCPCLTWFFNGPWVWVHGSDELGPVARLLSGRMVDRQDGTQNDLNVIFIRNHCECQCLRVSQ